MKKFFQNFIKNNMQKEQKSENWDNKKVFFPFFEFENNNVNLLYKNFDYSKK